ncbi:hypothetical protein COT72_03355 [archaeon CG10_big_fil_rev_8_21_14_0_10_43_11]|nr:MAG: hypothetical protein COT72_03355 [archaeon CG10_big_fil_rev_8_21_14_0_10_43_11]
MASKQNVQSLIVLFIVFTLLLIVVIPGLLSVFTPAQNIFCKTSINVRNYASQLLGSRFETSFFTGTVMNALPFLCETQILPDTTSEDWEIVTFSKNEVNGELAGTTQTRTFSDASNVQFSYNADTSFIVYTAQGRNLAVAKQDPSGVHSPADLFVTYYDYVMGGTQSEAHALKGALNELDGLALDAFNCFAKLGYGTGNPLTSARVSKPFTCSSRGYDFTQDGGQETELSLRHITDYMRHARMTGRETTYVEQMGGTSLWVCGTTLLGCVASGDSAKLDALTSANSWRDKAAELLLKDAQTPGFSLDESSVLPVASRLCLPVIPQVAAEAETIIFRYDPFQVSPGDSITAWSDAIPIVGPLFSSAVRAGFDVANFFDNADYTCNYGVALDEILDTTLSRGSFLVGYHDGYGGFQDNPESKAWELCGTTWEGLNVADVIQIEEFSTYVIPSQDIYDDATTDGALLCVRDEQNKKASNSRLQEAIDAWFD